MATIKNSSIIIKKLRQLMKNINHVPEPLAAYIVETNDAHQSEYLAECDKRREFLTNFTGSSGTAVITCEEQCLWTDGRYFTQAERQLGDGWKLMKVGQKDVPTVSDYLVKNLSSNSKVGFDPKLISFSHYENLYDKLNNSGIELVPLMENLVDLIWQNKPDMPLKSIEPHDIIHSGITWQEKIQQVREEMQKKNASILVITALDETAWLFNLRGSDVNFNPVFFAYSIVTLQEIYLFLNEDQLSSSSRKQLNLDGNSKNIIKQTADNSMTDSPIELNTDENLFKIQLRPYASIFESLRELLETNSGKVWCSKSSSYALVSLIPKVRLIGTTNPVSLKKAVKNAVEINGMKKAHIKDAVALCEFYSWLEDEIVKGTVTELSAAQKLHDLRKEQADFISESFETISASGPNGAIIHYKPDESTNRPLNIEEMYLLDSGAQYLDGTTDVTRTVHFGTPSDFERQMFTHVVKGHISLANCVFPSGINGYRLDVLARQSLWTQGLDYLHGTGHGVGCYLNVHEGPIGIHIRPREGESGLEAGNILSNEPGYYEENKFGIRLENLVLVTKKETPFNFNNKEYLGFETITLVPIQTKLLDPSLLTVEEIEWLDNYHQICREVVGNALKEQGKTGGYKWLIRETERLA